MATKRLPPEFELIARYFAPLAAGRPGALGLRDDAALIDVAAGRQLVVTADALVGGVHFLDADPPDLIARKMLRVNLSDLAAMGARPFGYVMTVALPAAIDEPWLASFVAGLAADQAEFDVGLLGGDTAATPGPLTLSVTAFGDVARGAAPPRRGARAGDLVLVSGTLGDAALGLRSLRGQLADLPAVQREFLVDRYRLPRPRVALGLALAESGLATAAIDVSDGLVADLGHICETSGLGAVVEAARLPLSAAAAACAAQPELLQAVLGGGDDYELLFAAPPDAAAALAALAGRLGLPLTVIGRMIEGAGVRVEDAAGREVRVASAGFRHF
ncbi:MAG: thiamine-phosphate kinase [Dongiaceae bacterium]